jgi:CxxC-x17-CxxC domain-containing protein
MSGAKKRPTKESKHPIMETAMEQQCAICGEEFLVPDAERHFRRERGLPDPVNCPECRTRQRSIRNADLIALYERVESHAITESGSISARGAAHGNDRSGSRSNVSKQRFNTVCAACGSETQVPFVPRGDRPVYCRDCFNARKGR